MFISISGCHSITIQLHIQNALRAVMRSSQKGVIGNVRSVKDCPTAYRLRLVPYPTGFSHIIKNLANWDLYNYSSNFPHFTGFPACPLVK